MPKTRKRRKHSPASPASPAHSRHREASASQPRLEVLSRRVAELQEYSGHLESVIERRFGELRLIAYVILILAAVLTALAIGVLARAAGI